MLKVLMVGPARSVKGGMTTVINNYFTYGLDKKVELKYIESCNDKNIFSKFFQEIKGLNNFKKNIKKYDIVHIHMASRRSTFRKIKYINIAKKNNKKVILHIHGGGFSKFFDEECNEKKKIFIKSNLNKVDKVIVLSEEWYDYFSKFIDNSKLEIIYNGVKLPEQYNKDLLNKNILFLGRINKNKGIYDLINAVKKVKDSYPDVCLYIGGSGEEDKVKSLVDELNLNDNVKMLGWINNNQKDEILRKCSIFVLPSYFEAMPMSILEAMAYGCITIASNVGSIPKVINNLENGFIIEPGDVEDISNKIKFILKNKQKRKDISSMSRITIDDKFNIDNVIKRLLDLYEF